MSTEEQTPQPSENDLKIRHFKLTSGDEVISIVKEIAEHMIILDHPMLVNTSVTERGFAFFFSSWQPMGEGDTCYLNPLHVISFVDVSPDIRERYLSMCVRPFADKESDEFTGGMHQDIEDNDIDPDDEDFNRFMDSILHHKRPGGPGTLH